MTNGHHKTNAHRVFAVFKRFLPLPLANIVRRWMTAFLQPLYLTTESGFFLSAILGRAVTKKGRPIPWYTFPVISFLSSRNFSKKNILEFGAGQSTLWWAERAQSVIAFEENKDWYDLLLKQKPQNVDLIYLPLLTREQFISNVTDALNTKSVKTFDIVIIDGGFREEAASLAFNYLSPGGALIVDDADGYGMYEAFRDKPVRRIDFFGTQPGVLPPHVTALFYKDDCFLLDAKQKMPIDFV